MFDDARWQTQGRGHTMVPAGLLLAMLVVSARREQKLGYPGWWRMADVEHENALADLEKRGLVKRRHAEWFMPTEAGFAVVEKRGNT